MSKKTYAIVSGIIAAVITATNTILALFDIPNEPAIIGAITAVGGAAETILALFVKPEETKKVEVKK